jgi:pseudaminic acid biosynthesis-associated methylase
VSETRRLESLWASEFGDAYTERNRGDFAHREAFWASVLDRYPAETVLEIGCNIAGNLRWMSRARRYGVDVNETALRQTRQAFPDLNVVWSPARDLPFRDRYFELVFTMGVLIHIPDDSLPLVLGELARCSARWVLLGEYHADAPIEVPYRGQRGALVKRDYGSIFAALVPSFALVERGFLDRDAGWDDVTWWMFERKAAGRDESANLAQDVVVPALGLTE